MFFPKLLCRLNLTLTFQLAFGNCMRSVRGHRFNFCPKAYDCMFRSCSRSGLKYTCIYNLFSRNFHGQKSFFSYLLCSDEESQDYISMLASMEDVLVSDGELYFLAQILQVLFFLFISHLLRLERMLRLYPKISLS